MKPSLEKLVKIFKLEAERGYDNRAVVGGLESMLSPWEAEARADSLANDLIQVVVARLRDYKAFKPASRADTLQGVLRRLQREAGVAIPLLPPPQVAEVKDVHEAKGKNELERPAKIPRPPRKANEQGESRIHAQKPDSIAAGNTAALNAPVTVLPGVGPRHGQTLAHLGIHSLGDMLYFFPRRYVDYSQSKPINRLRFGEEITIIGVIESVGSRTIRGGRFQIVEAVVGDGSGSIRVTWFNQPWISRRLDSGTYVSLSGKIDQHLGRLVMNNPELEQLDQPNLSTNRIVPVYPLTENITQRWLRNLMNQVVSYWALRVPDPIPPQVLQSAGLTNLSTALLQAHFPDTWEQLKAARQRLAFDEIFYLQLGVLRQKRAWQERTAQIFTTEAAWLENQLGMLPYTLTNAQRRVLDDLKADLLSGRPMNRLLQGDVGSGKTVIAALGIAMVVNHEAQAALMAPTSILAEQHYKNLQNILCGTTSAEGTLQPGQIRLLLGSTPEVEKDEIRNGLANGSIKVIIGTHALIEDPVTFSNFQLAVIDEQHRFGVAQRSALRSKGQNPHLLVMTATPIPRSLALTIYGDLDLSILDEMPPGRQAIETQVFYPRERERAYSLIRGQVEAGHQAFIIYPLIESSENSETKAAVEEYQRLQINIFSKFSLGLLHGRLKPDEKDQTITRFRDGEIKILVSTSVVEVGVDIPNATVMLIEGANRFGLAQLHQFRGRVGRGKDKSYCVLIPEIADEVENQRLSAMAETNDGFVLAERDLEQRGPGDFLGTRQAGYHSDLRLASLTDVHLIDLARRQAASIFEQDPELRFPEHQQLVINMENLWNEGQGDVS